MTAEEILALPIFGFSYREEVRDGKTIKIPIMPKVYTSYFGPDDIMIAFDADGIPWQPIKTEDGYRRRRMR